ncbi:MAG: HD domain-containing protein [Flavobacteriales bacterium]|nr:HD domain-containing protein [Flavobacteriales bacterium]
MSKKINCPLYGFISITPRMRCIIDTPEFKRLHNLRQLGLTYLIYPSANHTRFEHSLGVSHLAKILTTSLQKNQPELGITDNEIELIQIAGLIHDIGHGPFSHLYDYEFSPGCHHEKRGQILFCEMVSKYNLSFTQNEINFIIDCIDPPKELERNFKYQIVSNKICSIDVDKIDYIQRDNYHLGFGLNEKYLRLIHDCRVVRFNGCLVLGWPNKLEDEVLSLFASRYRLHKKVYNHHTVKSAEYSLINLLKKILEFEVPWNSLTDNIISMPINDEVINMKEEFDKREFPKLLNEDVLYEESMGNIGSIMEKSYKQFIQKMRAKKCKLYFQKIKIGFGFKNVLKNVVYFKGTDYTGYNVEKYNTFMAPSTTSEIIFRIYVEKPYLEVCKYEFQNILEDNIKWKEC